MDFAELLLVADHLTAHDRGEVLGEFVEVGEFRSEFDLVRVVEDGVEDGLRGTCIVDDLFGEVDIWGIRHDVAGEAADLRSPLEEQDEAILRGAEFADHVGIVGEQFFDCNILDTDVLNHFSEDGGIGFNGAPTSVISSGHFC